MNDNFVNFDTLSYGEHFENEKGDKFIKLKSRTDWMGWAIYFIDDYGNKNAFNALSYKGETVSFKFDDKVKSVKLPSDTTELGYSFKVENALLWKFVELVSESCDCQCGVAPFIGKPCPSCFAKQFRENQVLPQESAELEALVKVSTDRLIKNFPSEKNPCGEIPLGEPKIDALSLELKKHLDSKAATDKVVVSSAIVADDELKNKQIDPTNSKTMQTFNTLTEAVTAAINELKATGTLSLHQISTLIRQKTNDSLWEVLACVARPNNQNIKFWIDHNDVRRIVNDMYVNQQLDVLGFTGRQYNGTFMEYNFDTNATNFVASAPTVQANVTTQPGPVLTSAPVTAQLFGSAVEAKVDSYVKSQIADGNRPNLKAVQSAIKTNGITCQDFKSIVEGLGYKVTPGVTDCFSTYIVG